MKTFRLLALAVATLCVFAACETEEPGGDGATFTVTITDDGNGTAVADPAEAAAGETVTITATPSEGFVFGSWSVTEGGVSLADATAATTKFTMPAEDVVINVTFSAALDDTEDILPLIKDEALKEYIELRMESIERINETTYPAWDNGDGKLTAAEAAEVTAMNIVELDVETLSDLQYFPNLEILLMDWIPAGDGAEYLSGMTKLRKVSAEGVYFTSELDLSGCTELVSFSNSSGDLSNGIDVSTCSKLVELNLYDAYLTELDLSGCSSLATIDLTYNDIVSLDLSHCSNLEDVTLNYSTSLENLSLPENSKISAFSLSYSNITSLDTSCLPEVEYMSVGKNSQLADLDMTKCPDVITLICQYSPVGELDLSLCPNVDALYAASCKLTSVNLSGCSKLFEIYLQHNNLEYIDASECGFYTDETTGEPTDTYLYHLGAQVEPGTEPGYDQREFELNHKAWAGYIDDDGIDWSEKVKPIEVEIILSKRHEEYWNQLMYSVGPNNNSWTDPESQEVYNLGHVNVKFL